ncbi:LON peptidase substrate-binding domain-containing protein [Pseudofulvimonas gallinarii]|jgi:Lon protease-like protein|uniref:Lon N-terminal domain-containing protein n=1 Tax=Pseudofulvimonas gallinarii TaxID=634155 RepID=A0A4S3KYZ9_9GAMM|nr:LON peptidase substrate-binding domain-containing protein [Pseudofulvimonas gallinarii]TCS96203.1 hypothetical protein EDC25_11657 [Pseudofulvimonas gallinarii]THD14633.1 hypothetical protein B1808_02950 [Pseudofulvimonas gallinarii]
MTTPETLLPLFPLRTVLFPGGRLQLRIFERRYLDLVRDCARGGSVFGVCLIVDGDEAGGVATPAAIGTSARIVDFDHLPEGLLGITIEGETRFHTGVARVRDNGLITASVRWLHDGAQAVSAEHGLLVRLLETLLENGGEGLPDALQLDDADWVSYRLAERLPMQNAERQALLQLDDAGDRLDRLLAWLSRDPAQAG